MVNAPKTHAPSPTHPGLTACKGGVGFGTIAEPGERPTCFFCARLTTPEDPRERAAALRRKARWHIARAGSGGSWKLAEAYEAEADEIERTLGGGL